MEEAARKAKGYSLLSACALSPVSISVIQEQKLTAGFPKPPEEI